MLLAYAYDYHLNTAVAWHLHRKGLCKYRAKRLLIWNFVNTGVVVVVVVVVVVTLLILLLLSLLLFLSSDH